MPTACPFTAAITGFRTLHAGNDTPPELKDEESRERNVSAPDDKSAPAQKAGGVPVNTTARMSSSLSQRLNASDNSSPMPSPKALRTSGLFKVMVATPLVTSNKIVRNVIANGPRRRIR
jgi:hypothetical protein